MRIRPLALKPNLPPVGEPPRQRLHAEQLSPGRHVPDAERVPVLSSAAAGAG